MYSYTYDERTGGILLNTTPTGYSKEPRPVYASELDILGFDKLWNYDKQNDYPYAWAEANNYWYRGKHVAKLKGGNLYTAPEIIIPKDEAGNYIWPEPNGNALRHVNIDEMIKANSLILDIIEQTTVKKILSVYEKYKDKVDLFHVAYSGGKDSAVLLDLVKKALPKKSFVVVFGDTGMEFPDTYDIIELAKKECESEEIPFYIAKSHFKPEASWELFGPPSRVLRWCCSVHKSTPQILQLREITGRSDYKGLAFIGIRAQESSNRAGYEYENYGKKQKGQYSHNSILEWTAGEVWLYIYANGLLINESYKKGNPRAGCLYCPMVGGISDYSRYCCYAAKIDNYTNIITETYSGLKWKANDKMAYITSGAWSARKNGRDIKDNTFRCIERTLNECFTIEIKMPTSNWLEWIKTLGDLKKEDGRYYVMYGEEELPFHVNQQKDGYIVSISEKILKGRPSFSKMFRQVFRKASYCQGCGACEVNCKKGAISFVNGVVKINNCIRCHECHEIDSGCLLFHSLRHSQGGGMMMKKSINSFAGHAPKVEWLRSYFELKDGFFSEHTLGPTMYDMFRRFLRDASLNDKNSFTKFAGLICDIGWESDVAMGLVLINLANENPQVKWYVKNINVNCILSRIKAIDMLVSENLSDKAAKSILGDFKRLVLTPIGTNLHFGYVTDKGEYARTKCSVTDPKVVLYGLFKFAEKCNDYKEFTLATLLNDSIDRDGISPTRIFGLDRDDMIPILLGLTAKYPEFINASFTHDLEKINLAEDKSSSDVLNLFREER